MLKGYIYRLTSPSNKVYIGQSIDVKKRFNRYKNLHCKNQTKLYRALIKYGFDKFKIDIIKTIESDNKQGLQTLLNEWEILFIEQYNSNKIGYNVSKGGNQGRLGVKESEETIQKKKNIWTEEKKKEHSKKFSGQNNPMFGVKMGRAHNAKYVEQYDLDGMYIATFDSTKEASEKVKTKDNKIIDSRNIRSVCIGKRKTAGGYFWKYHD